ncbi:phosphoglycerate kinase, chloroplastic-like [Dorcoceras hygrometricum]|uniref:Phosphoglycerate kinase, chloroplastic-like n=1 Tax=Dorcoceras hygrometricum TaxID=472368 RepID=A0A2Z7DHE4_9LAMI|nr:phosphoglycerate kinase, chloroplastic-like [Dorcoceras hygrometricum]
MIPLGITDSACKNQLVVVSVQYGLFNPYIPIRSTTIGKSRVAIDPIAMHTSWRSNSDITSVTSIGYPRMSASGESSTTMHRLLHASGSHPNPDALMTPTVSMKFRVVRTNQYNQDLGLIHSTNGNHLESPKEGSSIDHQVTIYLHAQNITMFPTNETCTDIALQRLNLQFVRLIRSTTRFQIPSLACTRKHSELSETESPCRYAHVKERHLKVGGGGGYHDGDG